MHPLTLDGYTYRNLTSLALHHINEKEMTQLEEMLISLGAGPIDLNYNGTYSGLLNMLPNMAAFNISKLSISDVSLTVIYNDTFTHSLPILLNLINNVIYK